MRNSVQSQRNNRVGIRLFLLASFSLALSACAAFVASDTSPEAPQPPAATQPPEASQAVEPSPSTPPTDIPAPTETPQPIELPKVVVPLAEIPDPDGYEWVRVGEEVSLPVLLTHAGDGSGRLFLVGQQGMIWLISEGELQDPPFLDIRNRVSGDIEQGLLGLAFHPNYAQNGYFYLNYTEVNGDTRISRFQVSADPNQADPGSEILLMQVAQPYSNHNGGHLEFGPDGMLYIALGDGGSGGDPQGNGQSLDTLLGSILRIDVDGNPPYAIPKDNPFANGGGRREIWVYGLRNPWRFSFDSLTDDLYIGDVGQNAWEEIDFLPGGSAGGTNFGWNYFEGNFAYKGSPPADLLLIPPVLDYRHASGRCSVIGGRVYRGEDLPAWQSVYLYADFCTGEVFALARDADGEWQNKLVFDLPYFITSFGVDERGEIYLTGQGGGLFVLREG